MLFAAIGLAVLWLASTARPVCALRRTPRRGRSLAQRQSSKGFRIKPFALGRRGARKPEWVRHEVLRLEALLPDAGSRTIEKLFNRLFAARRRMTVSKSYVAYTVRDHRHEIEFLRRRIKHRVPGHVAKNRLWALDLTGKGDTADDTHWILGIADHGTRKLLAIEALPNKNLWTLLGHLFLAIGRFAGIVQQFTAPGCPWQNGRIELLFGTLKGKLDRLEIDSREALKRLLAEFRFWYNVARPHQHLGGLTPAEAWRGKDAFREAPKAAYRFEPWDGLLRGFYLRH